MNRDFLVSENIIAQPKAQIILKTFGLGLLKPKFFNTQENIGGIDNRDYQQQPNPETDPADHHSLIFNGLTRRIFAPSGVAYLENDLRFAQVHQIFRRQS